MSILRLLASVTVSPGDLGLQQNDPTSSTTVPFILKFVFGLAGAVALIMIIIGAFQFTLSRGNPNAISKARNTILYAIVGLVVILLGYGIVNFVVKNLK